MRGDGVTDHPIVAHERLGHLPFLAIPQQGRTFDVGEEESRQPHRALRNDRRMLAQRRVIGGDGSLQINQLGAGLETEIVEHSSGPLTGTECLDSTTVAV